MNIYGRHGLKMPDADKLRKEFRTLLWRGVKKKYGVSDSTICKWRRVLGLVSEDGKRKPRDVVWVESAEGCWNCTSHMVGGAGYPEGSRKIGRRSIARVMYEKKFGKIPGGLVIRHKCDDGLCVNPDHLETGTQVENLKDAYVRKRNAYGERHGNAKLTAENVVEMRALYEDGWSLKRLAERYGVSTGTICPALKKKTWRRAVEDLASD